MNWLTKIIRNAGTPKNAPGLDDGGLGIGGKLFDGQSSLFTPDPLDPESEQKGKGKGKGKGKVNVHQKKRPSLSKRPGEPEGS